MIPTMRCFGEDQNKEAVKISGCQGFRVGKLSK